MKKHVVNINIEKIVDKIEINGNHSIGEINDIRNKVIESMISAVKEFNKEKPIYIPTDEKIPR